MWLFETAFIIDLVNGDESAVKKAQEIDAHPAFKAVLVITAQEYLRGIYYLYSEKPKAAKGKIKKAEADLSRFEILPVDYSIARKTAELEVTLLRKGRPISVTDAIIAATAIHYGLLTCYVSPFLIFIINKKPTLIRIEELKHFIS